MEGYGWLPHQIADVPIVQLYLFWVRSGVLRAEKMAKVATARAAKGLKPLKFAGENDRVK